MKYLTLLIFVFSASVSFSQDDEGPIKVYLASGKVISTRYVFIDQGNGWGRPFVRTVKDSKEKIKIDEVDHIEGPDQDNKYRYVRPIFFNGSEVWAERTFMSDRITMYYVNVTTWGVGFPSTSKYIQYTKDNGPLTKMRVGNVKRDVKDNEESMVFVKKAQTNVGIQAGLYVAGVSLAIASAVQWSNEDEPTGPVATRDTSVKVPPTVFVGIALCIVPSIIKPGKQKNLVKALEAYK